MEYTIISEMAGFCSGIRYEDLPQPVQKKLKLCIMDALECCLAGKTDIRERGALASISRGKTGPATLILETGRASAEDAAFYNTVKGALTSRNDSSRTGICHPGSIVIPAVLALAEENKRDGKKVLEAILAGYETMIRLGTAMVKAGINKSFRNTSLVAAFGTAFAAAGVLGLSREETASAGSFACHFAGGVNQWAVDGTGEDVFQNGWGSRNGILAARLAACKVPGSPFILEGKDGLLSAFGALEQKEILLDGLGEQYDILSIMHKPIDSCFMVQASCQAALPISQWEEFDWRKIKEVKIYVPAQAKNYPGCDNIKVESFVQGIMSIQLGTASTLVNKSYDHIDWAPPFQESITEVMKKCKLYEEEEMTKAFPALQGSRVVVVMEDGMAFSNTQEDVRPLSEEEVVQRFRRTAREALGEETMETLYHTILTLEHQPEIGTMMGLMTGSSGETACI